MQLGINARDHQRQQSTHPAAQSAPSWIPQSPIRILKNRLNSVKFGPVLDQFPPLWAGTAPFNSYYFSALSRETISAPFLHHFRPLFWGGRCAPSTCNTTLPSWCNFTLASQTVTLQLIQSASIGDSFVTAWHALSRVCHGSKFIKPNVFRGCHGVTGCTPRYTPLPPYARAPRNLRAKANRQLRLRSAMLWEVCASQQYSQKPTDHAEFFSLSLVVAPLPLAGWVRTVRRALPRLSREQPGRSHSRRRPQIRTGPSPGQSRRVAGELVQPAGSWPKTGNRPDASARGSRGGVGQIRAAPPIRLRSDV